MNLQKNCFSEQEQDKDITYQPELLQDLQYHLMQRREYGSPVRYLWVDWKEMPFEEVPHPMEIAVDVEYGPYDWVYYY